LGALAMGLGMAGRWHSPWPLVASGIVTTVALIVADNYPVVLDQSIQPLQPVLQSNFWLTTHVLTVTLSYAAFALAMGLGTITLGYFLRRCPDQTAIDRLTYWTHRSIQWGLILLAVGTVLGGIWADYSWGRFWGWDPKEVWALVTLLGYLAIVHLAHARWIGPFGLASSAVMCFSLVLMAWYGVNFLLGTGLHSYGFGGGGREWVFGLVTLQALYLLAAVFRATPDRPSPTSSADRDAMHG